MTKIPDAPSDTLSAKHIIAERILSEVDELVGTSCHQEVCPTVLVKAWRAVLSARSATEPVIIENAIFQVSPKLCAAINDLICKLTQRTVGAATTADQSDTMRLDWLQTNQRSIIRSIKKSTRQEYGNTGMHKIEETQFAGWMTDLSSYLSLSIREAIDYARNHRSEK